MPSTLSVTSLGTTTALPELSSSGAINIANDGPNPVYVTIGIPGSSPTLSGTRISPLMIAKIPCASFSNILTAICAVGQTANLRISSPGIDAVSGRSAIFGPALMQTAAAMAGTGTAAGPAGQVYATNPASVAGVGAATELSQQYYVTNLTALRGVGALAVPLTGTAAGVFGTLAGGGAFSAQITYAPHS